MLNKSYESTIYRAGHLFFLCHVGPSFFFQDYIIHFEESGINCSGTPVTCYHFTFRSNRLLLEKIGNNIRVHISYSYMYVQIVRKHLWNRTRFVH